MKTIPVDVALRAARRLVETAGAALVLPGDWKREAVLYGLAAVHLLTGSGWSLEHARQNVSVTLPSLASAVSLLAAIPVVGPLLAALCSDLERPTIYLSPAALADGVALLGTVQHELGHVGQTARGGLLWCLAYGVVPEVRAGAETPCYGCSCAHAVQLGGADVGESITGARESLRGYGLDATGTALSLVELTSIEASLREGVDPTGTVEESLAALAAEGWTP